MKNETAKYEYIGPAQAREILTKVHPRQSGRDSQTHIMELAQAMADGTWDEGVSQSITISAEGELMDGYHRMKAVDVSNSVIRFLVVRGAPSSSFKNYDATMPRSRSFRMGMDKPRSEMLGYLFQLFTFDQYRPKATLDELSLIDKYFGAMIDNFFDRVSMRKSLGSSRSAMRVAFMLRMSQHPEHADQYAQWFTTLASRNGALNELPNSLGVAWQRMLTTPTSILTKVDQFVLFYMALDPARWKSKTFRVKQMDWVIDDFRAQYVGCYKAITEGYIDRSNALKERMNSKRAIRAPERSERKDRSATSKPQRVEHRHG